MPLNQQKKRTLPFGSSWKYLALQAVCLLAIAVFSGYAIRRSYGMTVLYDEFGYWGVAATMAGRNWSALLAGIPYYSFGYGFLLVPLFWLNLPSYVMYRLALLLNVGMLALSFEIAIVCLRRLFPSLSRLARTLIALTVTMYPSFLMEAQIAWPETLLVLMYWVVLWLVLCLLEKPTAAKSILLALATAYCYAVHMRTVGVVLAVCATMLLCAVSKKITWKHLAAFGAVMLVLLVAHKAMKTYLTGAIFTASDFVAINDYSGQATKFQYILGSWEGIKSFIRSVCGKLLYIGTGTLALGFVALRKWVISTVSALWKWARGRFREFPKEAVSGFFLLLSFGLTFCVDAVYILVNTHSSRLDAPIYGRYMELAFGPLIACGLAYLMTKKVHKAELVQHLLLLLACAYVTDDSMRAILAVHGSGAHTNWLCVGAWQNFYNHCAHMELFSYTFAFVAMAFLMTAWTLAEEQDSIVSFAGRFVHGTRGQTGVRFVAVVLVPAVMFGAAFLWGSFPYNPPYTQQESISPGLTTTMQLFANGTDTPGEITVVAADADEMRTSTAFHHLQGRIPNTLITVTYLPDYEQKKAQATDDTVFAAIGGSDINATLEKDYVCILDNGWYRLYAAEGSTWHEKAKSLGTLVVG